MASSLSFEDPIFSSFAFYATVVILKMMVMSLLTARVRLSKGIFANAEDGKLHKDPKVTTTHPEVERVRRCHQNDIENIVPFVLLGILYVLTGPDPWWAVLRFRVFAASRILHTICYLTPIPQPSRALMFGIGLSINVQMAVSVLRAM
ncbi:hypothetical protein FSP39_014478 [Pinctada imbricata]|uniref:Microsomal glutathione S-transferase 1 n=1 Tax=Pinctada imbricata TaxID=66713 RepID=A0AA89CAT9_PINIB|nr:hypothetical protein FSP39_014478 [Pinctada imbricata]